jgi:hypothetical protein
MARSNAALPADTSVAAVPAVTSGPAFAAAQIRCIDDLRPYEKNARLHDEGQLRDLRASMMEFGWTIPILIDEHDGVLAGHARLLVGRELGYDEVPVIVAAGWTAAQKKAYILADNKLTERGGWDWKLVSAELQDLQAAAFDLTLTGFESYELEPLLAAHWVPPASREGDRGTETEPKGQGHSINLTPHQYREFMNAVGRARTKTANDGLTEGDAVLILAEAYQ